MAEISWKRAWAWQVAAVVLSLSWVIEPVRSLWDRLDWTCYHGLQLFMTSSKSVATTTALLNAPVGNWVMCLFLAIGVFPWLFGSRSWGEFARRAAEGTLYVLLFFFAFFFISRWFFGSALELMRISPSLVEAPLVDLQSLVPALKVKWSSRSSFPSDHALQLLLLALFAWRFKPMWRWYMIVVTLFFCCPRLASGGHWLTDCGVGGLAIAMTVYAWGFASPLFEHFVHPLEWAWRKLVGLPAQELHHAQPTQ